jgi:hypothetical protein
LLIFRSDLPPATADNGLESPIKSRLFDLSQRAALRFVHARD